MNKHIIYIVAAALALVSCQGDAEVETLTSTQSQTTPTPQGQTLVVPLPSASDTRIEFVDGESIISLLWQQEDKFTVYSSAGERVVDFEYYAIQEDGSAIFIAPSSENPLTNGASYTAIYPAVEGVTTLSDHRDILASRISMQSQVGGSDSEHLNEVLRMEGDFSFDYGDNDVIVSFEHTLAVMRVSFSLEGGATPTEVTFRDANYSTYTIPVEGAEQANSYSVYFAVEPDDNEERTIAFIISDSYAGQYSFSTTSSVNFQAGRCYASTIPSLTQIPTGYTPLYTAQDIYNIRDDLDGSYIMMSDIDLSEYDSWSPIGSDSSAPFAGVFDGGKYKIEGLKIDASDASYQGLFGYAGSATISNITLSEPVIKGENYVAALVGCIPGSTRLDLEACAVEGGSVEGSEYVGGLVGGAADSFYSSSFTSCYNTADISGDRYTGGLAGYLYIPSSCYITSCYNEGEISGSNSGGLVGWLRSGKSVINSCHNLGDVTADEGSCVGGLFGQIMYTNSYGSTTITSCYNQGGVSGERYIGGIVGDIETIVTANISDCYNTGEVSGSSSGYVGGIIGNLWTTEATISDCYNTNKITSEGSYVGGVIGWYNLSSSDSSSISDCYNSGDISGGYATGGVVGEGCYASIARCFNIGKVSGGGYVGGIAGRDTSNSSFSMTSCYNLGSVTGSSSGVGGVIGSTNFSLTSCYNRGDITVTGSSNNNGGVVGETATTSSLSTITSCYNTGAIYCDTDQAAGGIAGFLYRGSSSITDCYFIDIADDDDVVQAVAAEEGVDNYPDMRLTSTQALNDVVSTMNSAAEQAGYTDTYFVEGSPTSSTLPYLSWEL